APALVVDLRRLHELCQNVLVPRDASGDAGLEVREAVFSSSLTYQGNSSRGVVHRVGQNAKNQGWPWHRLRCQRRTPNSAVLTVDPPLAPEAPHETEEGASITLGSSSWSSM